MTPDRGELAHLEQGQLTPDRAPARIAKRRSPCGRSRAGQQVLDTLRQYCGATTQAGSIWTALEGYVRVSEELKASRERIAHLEGILQDIILADADVEQAAANRAEVMDAARKESPTTDTRRRSAG